MCGGAGHDRHGNCVLLRELLADKTAEYCHGGCRRRKLRHKLRVLILNMMHPCGAIGAEHGKLFAGLHALGKLTAFLLKRQECRVCCAVHLIRSHESECGNELSADRLHCGYLKLLGKSDTDCGSDLNIDLLVGVKQSVPESAGVVLYGDRSGGTHGCALTATDAVGVGKLHAKAAGDGGVCTSPRKVDCRNVLNVFAHSDALCAQNALGRVTDYGRR